MAIIDPHTIFNNGQNVDISKLSFYASLKVTKRNRLSGVNQGSVVINLLGNNTTTGLFTTDWTNNQENFGIKSIDVKMTPSYVPQIDIVYEDVRGQSLFNNNSNSKYKILFDFPPPIFDLTLKGYYGQPVTYRLHLIKTTSNLTNNGSFEIRQSMVGFTYAPLSDLMLDYLYVAPYLDGGTPNLNGTHLVTTLELKKLSSQLSSIITTLTSTDKTTINSTNDTIARLRTYQPSYVSYLINKINNIAGQNTGVYKETKTQIINNTDLSISYSSLDTTGDIYNTLQSIIQDEITFFKTAGITNISISPLPNFNNIKVIQGNNYNSVGYLKLSNVDTKISDTIISLNSSLTSIVTNSQAKTKALVQKFIPGGITLKQVLTILLTDAYNFYNHLKKVVDNAQTNRANTNDTSHGESSKYAFPEYFITTTNNTKVKSLPQNNDWDEVKFVNNYINAKLGSASFVNQQNITGFNVPANLNDYKVLPINVFDSVLVTNTPNIYDTVDNSNLIDTIVRRGYVLLGETESSSSNSFFADTFVKNEINNITAALQDKPTLFASLINTINNNSFSFTSITSARFNTELKNNPTSISGATVGVTYSGSSQFLIYTSDKFITIGGIPSTDKSNTTSFGSDNFSTAYSDYTKLLGSGDLLSEFINDNAPELCQYNVPFYKDKKYAEYISNLQTQPTTTFNSDFIIDFPAPPKATPTNITSSQWLISICDEKTLNPFDLDRFKKISAIYEIPFYILAWWGYNTQSTNPPDDNYKTLPNNVKNTLHQIYLNFDSFFNRYFGAGFNNSDGSFNKTNYVKDIFFTKSIEIVYILMGDTVTFNSSIENKQINFIIPEPAAGITKADTYYFQKLKDGLVKANTGIINQQKQQQTDIQSKLKNDDIKTQLYYSLKSFVDRWMLGDSSFNIGDLLNPDNIDNNFLMIDRGYNNIGSDVVLDLTPLYDTQTTADTSVFTFLLNLLSKNNFEFFALPSYVNYSDTGLLWNQGNVEKIFGTTNVVTNSSQAPKFICMYIGGTSARLDINNTPDLSLTDDSDSLNNITDLNNVFAFAVDFGTQNQSFFTNVQLDQAEFKETNESIKILDNIANSSSGLDSVTNTKGNNLFNVYEQRSYTCTVNGLGNVMLQPTMYFDLRNIAMFKGAYLITEVDHHIVPNKFDTSFKGVRIPKYPKPYVTDYSVIANLDNGASLALTDTQTNNFNIAGRGVTKQEVVDIKTALVSNNLGSIVTNTPPLTPKEKALLDTIAYAEGTLGRGNNNGYDIINGGSLIPGWTPTYKQGISLTLGKAQGRYQFLTSTWTGYGTGTGVAQGEPNNKLFTSTNQDLTALNIIKTKRLNVFNFNIENITKDNFINYVDALSPEWVSFPFYGSIHLNITKVNPSWSIGQGWAANQPVRHTLDELWVVYSLALNKYLGTDKPDDLANLLSTTNNNLTAANQQHINSLRPELQSKFTTLINTIQQQTGWQVNITSSYRSYNSQTAVNEQNSKNAQPGTSLHEYGIAFDMNLIKNGVILKKASLQSDWMASGAVTIAKNMGFAWGGDAFNTYYDPVHFETTNNGTRYSGTDLLAKARAQVGVIGPDFDGRKILLG